MPRKKTLRTILLVLTLGAGLYTTHFLLGRPDRMKAAERRMALFGVRDQVLRYESERGHLPLTLHELVPAYLREDQLVQMGQPLYAYDAEQRHLAEVVGAPVSGIIGYTLPPFRAELPPPDESVKAVLSQSLGTQDHGLERNAAQPTDLKTGTAATGLRPHPTREPHGESLTPVLPPRPGLEGDLLTSSQYNVPCGPDLPDPPAGTLVFEAEHFSEFNYGWEAFLDARAAGGAYLHCKEGLTNRSAQIFQRVGNFYDIRSTQETSYLRYHLKIPKDGRYHVYGRLWATDTHCSNGIYVAWDHSNQQPEGSTMINRTPFRWGWSLMEEDARLLTAGDHYLYVFIHEDGVRLDQLALSPAPLEGGQAFKANFLINANTAWAAKAEVPVHVSLDYNSMVIGPGQGPSVRVVLRRIREDTEEQRARLVVRLKGAGPEGQDYLACDGEIRLAKLPELSFLKIPFEGLCLDTLSRREFLLVAELTANGKTLGLAHVPLQRPYDWELLGPGKYIANAASGPLDADGTFTKKKEGDARAWKLISTGSYDHLGVLDLGVEYSKNSQHPMQHSSVYARTRVQIPKTDQYLLKIQSDDQLVLWIDGQEVFRQNEHMPVSRSGCAVKFHLMEGEHRVRFRLNQTKGRWQAALRFRTADDEVSSVTGLSAPHEAAVAVPK